MSDLIKADILKKKWIGAGKTSWFVADARAVNGEKMKRDQKSSKWDFCHQGTMGLDGLSTPIIPKAKSDSKLSNSNSPFFTDKENMGSTAEGVPYCRLARQIVTEKLRSQIQRVSSWILMNWMRPSGKSQVCASLKRTFQVNITIWTTGSQTS